jgi:hypothetical protein
LIPKLDLEKLNTHSLFDRPSKVQAAHLGKPAQPGATVADLLDALPDQLAARSLRNWRDSVVKAVRNDRPVIAALGGHVIKTGCAPFLIDWVRRGVLTAVCMNGSAAIHDIELALAGRTSEDVEARLPDGSFGMTRETADFFARGARAAAGDGIGLGEALGRLLLSERCRHPEASLLRAAAEAQIPATVHVALGTDIVHMHSCASGEQLGAASMSDFRTVCSLVADLEGGVWMNLGSAVLMPEIFLKAVSIARNLRYDLAGMTTVDLDMIRQYRGRVNVLERHHANGIALTGHHEIMIPLIHSAVVSALT